MTAGRWCKSCDLLRPVRTYVDRDAWVCLVCGAETTGIEEYRNGNGRGRDVISTNSALISLAASETERAALTRAYALGLDPRGDDAHD